MDWGENADTRKMESGDTYTSCFDLVKADRVRQYKDLCCSNNKSLANKNINEIKEIIDTKYTTPKYHIIRPKTGKNGDVEINNIKEVFGVDIEYKTYDQESEIKNINTILEVQPVKHTFIFIKEKLRCAITLTKTYLGILYERFTSSPSDSVMIQGLLGRATGYGDTRETIIFTNIESISRYKDHWDSGFKDRTLDWKSLTTYTINDKLTPKSTFNNPMLIGGMTIPQGDISVMKESRSIIIIDITDKNIELCARNKGFKTFVKALVIANENLVHYETYELSCWKLDKDQKYKKWGLTHMLSNNAKSTGTNIKDKSKNILLVYLYAKGNKLIFNPWNGEC
jgi:hypothetical protein